jgi:hypothetical protein
MKNTAVFGIFRDRVHAAAGVDELLAAGFRGEDVSVLLADNIGTKDFAHEKHTKAPEGATAGASAGVVIGGTLGLLVGIGVLAIPGLGAFIAAGPIMAAFAGAGGGGVAGGIRKGERFSRSTAITPSGRAGQRRCYSASAPMMSRQPPKPVPTSLPATSRVSAMAVAFANCGMSR